MSSLIFVGLFSLQAGRRVHSSFTKRNGEKMTVSHAHYTTAVICRNPPQLPAELRVYSRANDIILPDETVAFVIAKGFIPPSNVPGDLLLDAMHVAPFPGNPAGDNYDDCLPDFHWPLLFGVGNVSGPSNVLGNHQVAFPVTLSEYVRGSPRQSSVQSVFPFFTSISPC